LERSRIRAGLVGLIALGLLGSAGAAEAKTTLRVCGDQGRLTCGRVSAPLDPSGRVHGRVSLYVERYAAVAHPEGTLVALAGGPGQSGVDLLSDFRDGFTSLLGSRALVVFDERGIGRSGPLNCRISDEEDLAGRALEACARSLGGRAAFYSSDDTVSDIEAIREALRLGRIDLYGVSYGTFPATQYARRYPSHLAHLVLDSSLPADGDLDVKLDSIVSIRRQLASICQVVCPGLDPTADLDTYLAGLPQRVSAGSEAISRDEGAEIALNTFYASDLDPFIRASIPAALRLAAAGDKSALVRLGTLASASEAGDGADEGPAARAAAGQSPARGSAADASGTAGLSRSTVVDAEQIATRCEDEQFDWSSSDSLAVRRDKLRQEQDGLSPAAVAPFTPAAAIAASDIAECEGWPTAGAHPAREPGRLAGVPTLILSGGNDVRTPLEQAATLAGQIPGSVLLAVPGVGHAVLVNDASGCAERGLVAFLAGGPVLPCAAGVQPPIDPVPASSFAALAPAAPLTGEPGEILTAVVITLRHDVGFTEPYAFFGLAVPGTVGGGLIDLPVDGRAGALLERISYIPSVSLTGGLKLGSRGFGTGSLSVRVGNDTYGTVRLTTSGAITGTLGGQAFKLPNAERQAIDAANGLGFITQLQ
jgi:pimeloyl-ACP methyl ester carboxylesterase